MVNAIIHTASRVIRRITSDANPSVAADETAVTVADDFDLAGGPWRLSEDGLSKLVPTEEELDAAFTPPISPQLQNVLDLLEVAAIDGGNSASARAVFEALRQSLLPRRTP